MKFYYFINLQPARFPGAALFAPVYAGGKENTFGRAELPARSFQKSVEFSSRNTFVYHIGIFAGFFETVGKINVNNINLG